MPESNLEKIKRICQVYNITPTRSKGQSFLINSDISQHMVLLAGVKPGDAVLEVGPGLGILTESLVKSGAEVVSVELDQRIFSFLKAKFINVKSLELFNGDILRWQVNQSQKLSQAKSYKVVANLPYNITSIFLRQFLTTEPKPASMVLMLQKEVASRICAQAGQMSLLAVSVQLYGLPQIVTAVSRSNFWPIPKVDSAVVKISDIKSQPDINEMLAPITEKQFWRVAKIGFAAKRKKLLNNLAGGLKIDREAVLPALSSQKIDGNKRAQDLSVGDWIALAKSLINYLN